MLSRSIRIENCIGGVPEPNFSHFVGTVAVVCPRACSCLLAWDAGGSLPSAWIIPVSCGSTVEVEAQQCLRPSYLTVFANKAVVEESLTFLLSGAAVPQCFPLPHPTSRIWQL